jgi:hypothetical protein
MMRGDEFVAVARSFAALYGSDVQQDREMLTRIGRLMLRLCFRTQAVQRHKRLSLAALIPLLQAHDRKRRPTV